MSSKVFIVLWLSFLIAPPLRADEGLDRIMGRTLFARAWVQAPASTRASDGLGPLFNARSCAACHPKGTTADFMPVAGGYASIGLIARLGDETGTPDPFFGVQLQNAAITGLSPEGTAILGMDNAPNITIVRGALAPNTRVSLRRAPVLAGRGRIDRIARAAILSNADPEDINGDGISGRAHILQSGKIGRFGWKADTASLNAQIAGAFSIDIGLSSPRFPDHFADCTPQQKSCRKNGDGSDTLGGGYELSAQIIELVAAYVRSIEPAGIDNENGRALFTATGCASCHKPQLNDDNGKPVTIFSDLLLHDMGEALSDGVGAFGTKSNEWRTAPLIGFRANASRLLHDGRAPDIDTAISAHGGEATDARATYFNLPDETRIALRAYLQNL